MKKLELTWIGKENQPKLEPRILIEDPDKSYCAPKRHSSRDIFDNKLIHGDNLLALKALEADHCGTIDCIYIDPPFNTGEAFQYYDDGIEHSLWLDLMHKRLKILHKLLSDSGTIFIHIDDNELGYLIVMLDEIFDRRNRVNIITFKQSSASGPKAINPGLVTTANYIVFYAKNKTKWKPNRIHQPVPRDVRYNNFIANFEKPIEQWELITLREGFELESGQKWDELKHEVGEEEFENRISEFVVRYKDRVVQPVLVRDKDINEDARSALQESRIRTGLVQVAHRSDRDDFFFLNGKQLAFYRNKVKLISGKEVSALAASNIWDDLLSNNVHKEGGVDFPKGKKPEALLERILRFATKEGDTVLDSFGGSGTTAAAAHKMNRRWITIELGSHCDTHIYPRLKSIIDGNDAHGITKSTNWKGGGGFRYYRLAPSLLEQDKWGNWVISKEYNAAMLAEALCKLEGFRYEPSDSVYWMHGRSSENDFLYATTQNLSTQQLQELSDDVGPARSLLVLCAAFRGNPDQFPNLTLKKIPKAVLAKCEWGHDDYSLKIENLPKAPESSAPAPVNAGRKTKAKTNEPDLFSEAPQ